MADKKSNEQKNDFNSAAERWEKRIDRPLTFLTLIFGIAAAYFTLIEWRVRSIVKDPEFVAEVARRTRPTMVFDADGRIISDTGVLPFLQRVPKIERGKPGAWDTRIIIEPKAVLASEPIVQALDESEVSVSAKKVYGTSWEILVTPRAILMGSENHSPTNLMPPRFRLEIVAP